MKIMIVIVALSLIAFTVAKDTAKECPAGQVLIKGACGKCPPGRYYDEYPNLRCVKCHRGTFKATEGQVQCRDCPPNSFSGDGAVGCISCPAGKVLLKSKECGTCPPGTFYDSHRFRCKKCEPSTFQPYENIEDACFKCSGDSSSDMGATKCTQCPAGTMLMSKGKCGTCPPGTFYDRSMIMCQECEVDTFQPDETIMERCLDCSGDTHSNRGATKCTKCPRGKALMQNGKCGSCPPGYEYYDVSCHKCFVNSFSTGDIYRGCEQCPASSYASPGATRCFTCPVGQALILKKNRGKCGMCRPGFFYDPEDYYCFDCGDGFVSAGGLASLYDCKKCRNGKVPNAERSACV